MSHLLGLHSAFCPLQSHSILQKLVTPIPQAFLDTFDLHRCKPGTLSVLNHLGREPEADPALRLL